MSERVRKRFEETIEAALEGTTTILERWLPEVEKSLKEQSENVSIDVTFRWVQDTDEPEGLRLEVVGKPKFPTIEKSYKASLSGGQLSLFKAPKAR